MPALNVGQSNFQTEVMESDRPVLLDFWAPWCGPCRSLLPVIEEIAQEHPEIKVCKVNVDEEQELASQFSVMSVPALFALRDGRVVNQTSGARPKQEILNLF